MKTKRVIKAKAQVQPVVMLNRSMIEKACRDLSSLNISLNHMGEINLSALTVRLCGCLVYFYHQHNDKFSGGGQLLSVVVGYKGG